jgi:hypothetical protein
MKRTLLIICIFVLAASCSDNEKAASDLSVIPSIIEFENVESTRKIYIGSNTAWVAKSNKDWCTIFTFEKFGNDTIEIKVSENTGYTERIAYISFNNPENTIVKTTKVIQQSLGKQMFRSDDSLMLVKFYDSTGGDGWTNKNGWKTANLDDWYGVVIKNDRVTALKFENNNLSGKLISTLGDLNMLDTIVIVSEKNVTGTVPASIAGLSNLLYLNISGTSLAGNIPPQLGNIPTLEELILSENLNFTGTIPNELGNLTNLKTLVINNLSESGSIPLELGKLRNLTRLALDSCKLKNNLPDTIFTLTNLEYLSLNNNTIQGNNLSPISALTKLKHLILSRNNFVGAIPEEFAVMELETLHLDNNYFNGTIPDGILNRIDGDSFRVCPQKFEMPPFSNYECE